MTLYCVGNNQFLIKGNENFASQKNKKGKGKVCNVCHAQKFLYEVESKGPLRALLLTLYFIKFSLYSV